MADELTEAEFLAAIRAPFGHKPKPSDEVLEAIRAPFGSKPQRFTSEMDIAVAEAFGRITATEAAQHRAKLGQQLSESTATLTGGLMQVSEATAVAPTAAGAGRLRVTLVTPGWGASGHYSPAVLEAAGRDKIWAAGTQCFADHPTQRDLNERPERSIRDLAAVLVSDARWTGSGLVAEAQLLPAWAETLGKPEMAAAIGMSIRASAEVEMGEAEGRRGRIVTKIVEGQSVDFVTRAGRGGRYEVLESGHKRWVW
jgi:hypothetical protein